MDWLIHGESFFSKKYVILKVAHRRAEDSSYCAEYALEVRKKEHLDRVIGAWESIGGSFSMANAEFDYLDDVCVIDRGQYLRKFDGCEVVDEDLVGKFEKIAESDSINECFYYISSLNQRCKRA